MRIFLIGSDPHSGLLYHLASLATELSRQGHEVHLATWGAKESAPQLREMLAKNNVPVHVLDSLSRDGVSALRGSNRAGRTLIRDLKVDVVHTFGPVSAFQTRPLHGDTARRVAMIASMGSASGNTFKVRFGARLLNRYTDSVIALCTAELRRLTTVGVDPRKINITYNPLNCDELLRRASAARELGRSAILSQLGLNAGRKWIGYFTDFKIMKRQDLLIRAFSQLASEFPEWNLVLAGDGVQKPMCVELASQLGIHERITFLPRLSNTAIMPLLASVDVVAHCSNAETFGYSIIEPLLLGTPLVSARAGIAYELQQAGQAEVFAADDCDGLIAALRKVLPMPPEIQQRAEGSPKFVRENFDVPVIARKLVSVYRGEAEITDLAQPVSQLAGR